MSYSIIGTAAARVEDDVLVRGTAKFIGDIHIPGMLEAVFVRSTVAAGVITKIDTRAAEAMEGVVGVITGRDLARAGVGYLSTPFYELDHEFEARYNVQVGPYTEAVLAESRVVRAGEAIALVLADTRFTAEDARDLVDVEITGLSVVSDIPSALATGAPSVDSANPGNIQARFEVSVGDLEEVMRRAPHTVSGNFRLGRSLGGPIENRGVIGTWDARAEELTLIATTQTPHVLRANLATSLGLAAERIRVRVPDMGGSFGGGVYPEEIAIAFAAKQLGRSVRWLEDRTEHLMNSRHSRDQTIHGQLAFDDQGKLLGLKVRIVQDTGACNPFGITLPFNVVTHIRSTYRIDALYAEGLCVLTNKTRNTPVRGAGRPEATFVIDRLVDMAARKLDLDSAEMRRRNLITCEEMPYDLGLLYRDGEPAIYDSGDFVAQFQELLRAGEYESWRTRQAEARREGRSIGVGLSCHVEGTGLGPHEGAVVRIEESGRILVRCGAQPHGQGHATVLSQVCAEVLHVPLDLIEVQTGDTNLLRYGGGTFGSRSAVTAGSAVYLAASAVRDKAFDLTAYLLEASVDDLVLQDGRVEVKGTPARGISLRELANALSPGPHRRLPDGMDFELEARAYFVPPSVTFGSGSHMAVVEVNAETGLVKLLAYTVVEDCGQMLNPAIVDGQQHGGVAHGIGNALLEEVLYDSNAQCLTGTLTDYLYASAPDVPDVTVVHRPQVSPLNPLGVKGTGEGATSSAPAAVVNAIVDALRPLDVEIVEIPVTPSILLRTIEAACANG